MVSPFMKVEVYIKNYFEGDGKMGIKQKLGMGVAAGVLGVSLVSGGTYAYFTSESVTETGTVSTGTIAFTDVTTTSFEVSNLVPGDGLFKLVDTTDATFGEHGEGHRIMHSLDFKYTGSAEAWVLPKDFAYEFTGPSGKENPGDTQLVKEVVGFMVNNVFYTYFTGIQNDAVRKYLGFNEDTKVVTLNNKDNSNLNDAVPVNENEDIKVWLKTGLQLEAGNEYQGTDWKLNFSLKAVQRAHNPELSTDGIIWTTE